MIATTITNATAADTRQGKAGQGKTSPGQGQTKQQQVRSGLPKNLHSGPLPGGPGRTTRGVGSYSRNPNSHSAQRFIHMGSRA
mmetsp:Transcript_93543/g.180330  ORF Transcript_93543/g.180330 Transcript_93543/m.180330 type:complete len:83 (+) Transcript_93543:154-402(+)